MTLELFLAPISEAAPCGENLEYDADFIEMEQISVGKAEQQFGSTIIPDEAPDWIKVEQLAINLLNRTKDLRLMIYLTRAWTNTRGLHGYSEGVTLIHQALMRYWTTIHPQIEIDGEEDPLFRINILAELGDKGQLVNEVRNAILLKNHNGEIALKDACSLLDNSKQECPSFPGGLSQLREALYKQPPYPGVATVLTINQTLPALRTLVREHLGESGVPEMRLLLKTFGTIAHVCNSRQTEIVQEAKRQQQEKIQATTIAQMSEQTSGQWHHAEIRSRVEAKHMLEKVKDYFLLNEPSHPAPIMIERIQRLIEYDFMAIIGDLAPEGMDTLETVFGIKPNVKNDEK